VKRRNNTSGQVGPKWAGLGRSFNKYFFIFSVAGKYEKIVSGLPLALLAI
jgi:hypothetical protein